MGSKAAARRVDHLLAAANGSRQGLKPTVICGVFGTT
jgi:hypothetical protein